MSWFGTQNTEEPKNTQIEGQQSANNDVVEKPIEYKRLIHPDDDIVDSLEDGYYDIVFSNGGWFRGSIKNHVFEEGKYVYSDGTYTEGYFGNRECLLTKGEYKQDEMHDFGTFIRKDKDTILLHGKNCKRIYLKTGIVYEGEITNGWFKRDDPVNGTFTIPKNLNLTYTPEEGKMGWWTKHYDDHILYKKSRSFNRNIGELSSIEFIAYKDGLNIDLSDKSDVKFTYPKHFKGLPKWNYRQLNTWILYKFDHLDFWKKIRDNKITGEVFSKMTDDHFEELGITGINLLQIRTEMEKIM